MKRTVFSLLAAFALCVSAAAAGPAVSCPSALLMEKQTGTVLFAQDEHTPREPASVTKIMTLLLVMEAIDSGALSYDDVVTGSAHAAGMGGSQIWLKENEQMTVRDLPFKNLVLNTSGIIRYPAAEALLALANGRLFSRGGTVRAERGRSRKG